MTTIFETATEGAVQRAAARFESQGVTRAFILGTILVDLQRRMESIQQGNPHMSAEIALDWLENDPMTFVSEAAARFDEAQLAALGNPPTTGDLAREIQRLQGIEGVQRIANAINRG